MVRVFGHQALGGVQDAGKADDRIEWCPQFVRHIGQEI